MRKILYILLLFLIEILNNSVSHSENVFQDDYKEYNENLYKKYLEMDMKLKNLAEKNVKKMLPFLLEAREYVNISASCTKNLFDLITGFRKLTNWSFNFFDAMGKLQSGIQTGNLQMFGEYEECIETVVKSNGKVDFTGQYCSLACKPYLPKVKRVPGINGRLEGLVNTLENASDIMKLFASKAQAFYAYQINVGLCVPSGCSKEDMADIVRYTLADYINCTASYCLKEGDIYYWTTRNIIIASVFVLLGIIIILSTSFDNSLEAWKSRKLGFKSKILQCFSLTRNFPKLMSTDISENSITCFNGIRVLTIFWVILGHEFFFHAVLLTSNHMAVTQLKLLTSFFSQIPLNGFVSVDIFFFMSGLVNCYSRTLIKQKGRSQPGILKVIVHRLWRIYPAYIAAFLLMFLLAKPQPFAYSHLEKIKPCEHNWWQNLLFINNLFGPLQMCMPQTWFLCVDMQLFLLTLFTIPVLLRKPKRGIILHVGMILITNLCSMSWWLLDDIAPSTLDSTRLDLNEAVKGYYIYTLAPVHVGPYVTGLLLGYIIATIKEVKIPKLIQLFGWIAASLSFVSMLFMTLKWNSGSPYTPLESALYGAWSRTVMVLGFSWLVFCCTTGHGGLINYILSLKLWIPLARITYMLYLVSPLIQIHHFIHMRFPHDFSEMEIIWTYFGNLSISILMCIALVLIIESPFIAMEKLIFGKQTDENKEALEKTNELSTNNVRENGPETNGKFTTIHL